MRILVHFLLPAYFFKNFNGCMAFTQAGPNHGMKKKKLATYLCMSGFLSIFALTNKNKIII